MPLYRWYLNSAVRTWIGATSFWQNARSKKNGIHQPELTAVRTAVRSGEKTLIFHLWKWRKNPLEPPQIRVFREQEKKSVHFWCNFWDTKRAASVCLSTTCGFLSAVRGGFEPPVRLPVRQFSNLVVSATHPSHQSWPIFPWDCKDINKFGKCTKIFTIISQRGVKRIKQAYWLSGY